MTRIRFSDYGRSPFERLIGHNREILDHWTALENAIFQATSLSPELLEQVRRVLAFGNECEYCMVKGGKPVIEKGDKRTLVAAAFAEIFARDHLSITDVHFEILKEEFSDLEISELCSFISFITASQKLGRIYKLTEEYKTSGVTTLAALRKSSE